MIDHIWSVLCGRSVTDRESNNVSLLDVVEQLNILGPLPVPDPNARAALPIQFELVSLWSRHDLNEPEESVGRTRLIAPNGEQIIVQEFPINLTENLRVRTQMRSIGFPLAGEGRYTFLVDIRRANGDWDSAASIPVQVVSVVQAPVVPAV